MAKVVLSALLDELTGKVAGSVFQNTVGGLQLRTKVNPRNPRSLYQQMRRSDWSFAALSWLTLNSIELQSWNDNAPAGSSGSAFFLQTNAYIQSAGQPLLRTYLPFTPFPSIQANFETLDPANVITQPLSAGDELAAGQFANVFATGTLSTGISFIAPSEYRYITSIARGTSITNPVDISAPYIARYGGVGVSGIVGLKFYIIDSLSGVASAVQFGRSEIT